MSARVADDPTIAHADAALEINFALAFARNLPTSARGITASGALPDLLAALADRSANSLETTPSKTKDDKASKQPKQGMGACLHCYRSKLKCDGKRPCARCVNTKRENRCGNRKSSNRKARPLDLQQHPDPECIRSLSPLALTPLPALKRLRTSNSNAKPERFGDMSSFSLDEMRRCVRRFHSRFLG